MLLYPTPDASIASCDARASHYESSDLLQEYERNFYTVQCDTADLVRKAQFIRFQVYCLERQYEDTAHYADKLERDEFDAHAVHSVLVDRHTNMAIGTVRLILPRHDRPELSFPIQQLLQHPALGAESAHFPLTRTAEVSRFSLSRQIHRHWSTKCGPLARLGLMQALVRMSVQNGITHWCGILEPKLIRMFAAMALNLNAIGDPVEHRGLRQGCWCNIAEALNLMRDVRPSLWAVLTEDGALV